MLDPATALLIGSAALTAAALVFWPVRGLFWRALALARLTERVRIEDALKHLHDAEDRGVPATLQSLAGALGLAGERAAALLTRLEELDLVEGRGGTYRLTARGRRDALRVIRVHRLWERYLSDETGFPPTEWHTLADVREHRMDPTEADDLARRLGEPRFDPHGDPIPTRGGEVVALEGRPLSDLGPGEAAVIVHLEDEPEAVYAQLVAEGLSPGLTVRVIEAGPRALRFQTATDEHVLAPVLAANVTVRPRAEAGNGDGEAPRACLSELAMGERAEVVGLAARCRGPERRRLLDLGLVPGTVVVAELRGAGGDPVAYRVRGALLALRRTQAELIHIGPRQ